MRINLVGYLLLASLSSCLTIIHPLVTSDNIIIDNRIDGTWVSNDSKVILIQKIMNSELKLTAEDLRRKDYTFKDSLFYAKHYAISYQQKDLRYFWLAGLVKIKSQYYLNLHPVVCVNKKGNNEYDLGDATSSIAKLEWKGDNTLSVHFLNGDRIREIILSGKARIKNEYEPLFGTFVITATAKELEAFLEKYGDYDNLFTGGETIDLVRKN